MRNFVESGCPSLQEKVVRVARCMRSRLPSESLASTRRSRMRYFVESSLGSAWMLRSPRSLDDVTDEVFC